MKADQQEALLRYVLKYDIVTEDDLNKIIEICLDETANVLSKISSMTAGKSFRYRLKIANANMLYFEAGLGGTSCVSCFALFPQARPRPIKGSHTIWRQTWTRSSLNSLVKYCVFGPPVGLNRFLTEKEKFLLISIQRELVQK